MLLFVCLVLGTWKVTLGKSNCEGFPDCEGPEHMKYIPRDVPTFNDYCQAKKAQLRCLKDFQDDCGKTRFVFFETDEIFDGSYDTLSEVCEEGTLLNTIVIENLKCFNETFGKTRCHEEADEFTAPFIRELEENEGSEPPFNIFCMTNVLVGDCALRATSDNCGRLVAEAGLEVLRRSKNLENACTPAGAQSILDKMDTLGLSEDKKTSITLLLEKIAGENDI